MMKITLSFSIARCLAVILIVGCSRGNGVTTPSVGHSGQDFADPSVEIFAQARQGNRQDWY